MQAALRWCAKHGVPFAPRSGGHNYAGYSTTTGKWGLTCDRLADDRVVLADGTVVRAAGDENCPHDSVDRAHRMSPRQRGHHIRTGQTAGSHAANRER
ncbi:hypothetical protein DMH03_33840 [Amycolatopsis sp. WAC 01376]|nr:hypothetical protein DMH03_33840 [Amycolatopsis sp. WAC 01376]